MIKDLKMDVKLQNKQTHLVSYLQTMESIRQADETRRIEASLKFMAKPYNIHRKLTQQNQAKMDVEHGITNPTANPKTESQNLAVAVDINPKNSHDLCKKNNGFIKTTQQLEAGKNDGNRKFTANIKTNSLFIEQETAVAKHEKASSAVHLKKSTAKEILYQTKVRKKENKMKRKMTKKQFKAEQRNIKMEIKMRKILRKRLKMTRKKADKQRKRAEKMLKFQNKLEKIFLVIYSYLKRLFDVFSLILGLTFIILGIFTAEMPAVPMVLIGTVFLLVGMGSLSLKFVRKVQAARRAENYKHSYLSTMQVTSKNKEVRVVI